jgi:predicted ester cyclase
MSAVDVAMALTDAFNNSQWDACGGLMTDDYTATGLAPMSIGKPELIGGEQAWHAASPDRHITLDQAREEGGVVKAMLTVSGTHTGTLALPGLPPIPPTGKRYTLTGNLTATVRGSQVAAMANEPTSPDVLAQLGVQVPPA